MRSEPDRMLSIHKVHNPSCKCDAVFQKIFDCLISPGSVYASGGYVQDSSVRLHLESI